MKKQTPLEFAHEFINDLKANYDHFNFSDNTATVGFNETVLSTDPELKILKSELNKIGFDIEPKNKDAWILRKI